MPVKKFVVSEIIGKKVSGGIPTYLSKISSSSGFTSRWLRSHEIESTKVEAFEKEMKKCQDFQREKRLLRRNLIKKSTEKK